MVNFSYGYSYAEIINIFQHNIIKKRPLYSYIIYGSYGSGKTHLCNEIARLYSIKQDQSLTNGINELSHYLNVYNIPDRKVSDNHMITIGMIRDIKDWMQHTSFKSKYKIIIIDDIHKMNENAVNAFLKILEEPIGNTLYIMSTTHIHLISEMIRSRSMKFKLNKVSRGDFIEILLKKYPYGHKISLKILYELCSGDINLSIEILKRTQFLEIINALVNNRFQEMLYLTSCISLYDDISLRFLKCLVFNTLYKLQNIYVNNKRLEDVSYLQSQLGRIDTILVNIDNFNLNRTLLIIVSILRECIIHQKNLWR